MSGKSGWLPREVRGGKLTSAMIHTQIDDHKRYSVACMLDAQGHRFHEAWIEGNAAAAVAAC